MPDLVKRLRSYNPFVYDEKTGVLPVLDTPYLEAADLIEAQEAEITRLREGLKHIGEETDGDVETMWIADMVIVILGDTQ